MTNEEKIRTLYDLPASENHGYSEDEIINLEIDLGVRLPEKLRAYYLSLGRNEAINATHNRLLEPDGEVRFSKDGYLVFYEENQGVASWGIRKDELTIDNPPVWGNYGSDEEPDWNRETATVEDFFLLMAVYNGTLGGLKYNANCLDITEPSSVNAGIVKQISERWKEVDGISWEKQKVYSNDFREVISLSFDSQGNCVAVFIGTNDQHLFDALLDEIEIDWSYVSYEDEEEEDEDEES
jgi:hypothetical protein